MPEISADLTAAAILLRAQSVTALIDGVLMRRVFYDDFDRSVAQGLGGTWGWHWYDSSNSRSNTATAYVDGVNKEAVVPSFSNYSNYESYVGFPLPVVGDLFFDFYVPASFSSNGKPTYGFTLNVTDYAGIYVSPTSATDWVVETWVTGETALAFAPTPSTWYRLHARWTESEVLARAWRRGDPEPGSWHQVNATGLSVPSDTEQPPFLDFYWAAAYPFDTRITNIEIWSASSVWASFRNVTADATIDTPTKVKSFGADALLYQPSLTANAILFATVERTGAPNVSPSLVGATSAASWSPTGSLTVNLPNGVLAGDTMILSVFTDSDGADHSIGVSGAWSLQVNDEIIGASPIGRVKTVVYTRIAGASEPSSITVTMSPAIGFDVSLVVLRDTGSYRSYQQRWTTSSPYDQIQTFSLSADRPGTVVAIFASSSFATGDMVMPAGLTEAVDSQGFYIQQAIGYGAIASAGSVQYTATITNPDAGSPVRSGIILFFGDGAGGTVDAVIFDGRTFFTGSFGAAAWIVPEDLPPDAGEIVIWLNGVDITDDVIFSDAEFMSQASGSPGTCRFRLKDMNYVYDIVVGQTLRLEVNGRNVWGGWVQSVKRQFFFPYTGSPLQTRFPTGPHGDPCFGVEPLASVPRALVVEGVDYNILFNKRYVFNKANPENGLIKSWPEDTHDDVQVRWLCEHDLDLSDDGIDYTSLVEHVGSPNPDARGNPAGAGWKWGDAMRAIARYPGAVWYIDPDKRLVYTDVDTATSGYLLTDTPDPGNKYELGYREMELLYNGSNLVNDAMVWGAGQGAKRVKFTRTRDQASIDAHGLWQVGDFRGDLWRQASVDKRSRSFVYGSPQNKRGGKDDAVSASVTLFKPAFRVAEKVDFWSHVFDFHDVIPVRRMRVTFPTTKAAKFELVLSHAIDEPWNTFEYWFPPIPIPDIVVPVKTLPNCPIPNVPAVFEEPDGTVRPLANFTSVFSDDFERDGGQPDGMEHGWWANVYGAPVDPTISGGQVTIGTFSYRLHLMLKNPVSGSRQFLLALDLTNWVATSGVGFSLSFGGGFIIFNNGAITCWGNFQYTYIDPTRYCGKKVYVRAVVYDGTYSAIRIWPQDDPEPMRWDATGPGYASWSGDPQSVLDDVEIYVSSAVTTKLMGITVFGSTIGEDWSSFEFNADKNGRVKGWGYADPQDGYAYAVTWGSTYENVSEAQDAHYGYGIAWGYFGPDHGSGAPNGASQTIVSTWTTWWNNHLPEETIQRSPVSVRVSGQIRLTLGRSRGIDNRGAYPGETAVLIAFQGEAITHGQSAYWVDGENPFWLGQDRLYMETVLVWDAAAVVKPFSFDVPTANASDQTGHFRWGVKVINPLDACRSMDPRGGPFMLPNGGGVNASTANVKYYGIWATVGGGGYLCLSNNSGGGTELEKICEAIPIDSIRMHELFRNGELWAVQLQSTYQPGTVDVTVDGTPARPALDFIESTPSTGVITFLNSFYGSKEIYVCYFPEENDVVEPPPYVPPGGVSQPW